MQVFSCSRLSSTRLNVVLHVQAHPDLCIAVGDIVLLLDDRGAGTDLLGRLGEIVGVEAGSILVHWSNGACSSVLPWQACHAVGHALLFVFMV